MKIVGNINILVGDDLQDSLGPQSLLTIIASSCFPIYAYEVLNSILSIIESLELIFTTNNLDLNKVARTVGN